MSSASHGFCPLSKAPEMGSPSARSPRHRPPPRRPTGRRAAPRTADGIDSLFFQGTPSNIHPVRRGQGTASIVGAFVCAGRRRLGAGTALLSHCVSWARQAGSRRCAVDFESMNPEGASFWLRHFAPICHSVQRVFDETSLAP